MNYERIYKREDGTRVKIEVRFFLLSDKPNYTVSVCVAAPGKKKYIDVDVEDDYTFRELPFGGPERKSYILQSQLRYATSDEINECKTACWELLKPTGN